MPRPKKPEGTKLTLTAVRLPVPTKQKLDRLSQLTGLSLQEHIRRAVEDHIEEQKAKGHVLEAPRRRRASPPAEPAPRPRRRPSFLGAAA